MPAIPVYSSSPIHASPTPAASNDGGAKSPSLTRSRGASRSSSEKAPYPPAQPGAVPSLPVQTAVPDTAKEAHPTRTAQLHGGGPPPPQPGAIPVAAAAGQRQSPPSPSYSGNQEAQAGQQATPTTQAFPPHMRFEPPQLPIGTRQAGTATGPHQPGGGSNPTSLQGPLAAVGHAHPPGYQQDVHASDFNSHQRAAHNASLSEAAGNASFAEQDSQPGVWDTAKRWASAAGESLVAAENEVWKRINQK